jgi:hypothetical protein
MGGGGGGGGGVSSQLHALAALPSGKKHFTHRIAGLIGPRRCGRFEEETDPLSLPDWEPRIVQPRGLVTVVAVCVS